MEKYYEQPSLASWESFTECFLTVIMKWPGLQRSALPLKNTSARRGENEKILPPLSSFVRRAFNILFLEEWWECACGRLCPWERLCVPLPACAWIILFVCLRPRGWHRFKELVINCIWSALDTTRFSSESGWTETSESCICNSIFVGEKVKPKEAASHNLAGLGFYCGAVEEVLHAACALPQLLVNRLHRSTEAERGHWTYIINRGVWHQCVPALCVCAAAVPLVNQVVHASAAPSQSCWGRLSATRKLSLLLFLRTWNKKASLIYKAKVKKQVTSKVLDAPAGKWAGCTRRLPRLHLHIYCVCLFVSRCRIPCMLGWPQQAYLRRCIVCGWARLVYSSRHV